MTAQSIADPIAEHIKDLVVLTKFLAAQGDTAHNVAYAVEKPWKYASELRAAKAINAHENNTNHTVWSGVGELDFYCNDCEWTQNGGRS